MIAERVKNLNETNVHVVDERENKKQAFHAPFTWQTANVKNGGKIVITWSFCRSQWISEQKVTLRKMLLLLFGLK